MGHERISCDLQRYVARLSQRYVHGQRPRRRQRSCPVADRLPVVHRVRIQARCEFVGEVRVRLLPVFLGPSSDGRCLTLVPVARHDGRVPRTMAATQASLDDGHAVMVRPGKRFGRRGGCGVAPGIARRMASLSPVGMRHELRLVALPLGGLPELRSDTLARWTPCCWCCRSWASPPSSVSWPSSSFVRKIPLERLTTGASASGYFESVQHGSC